MADFRDKFINEHLGRSVEDLLNEFTTALEQFSSQCIPTKLIRGKSSLPWITQEIRLMIRKRNHIYNSFKKTGDQTDVLNLYSSERQLNIKLRRLITCTSKVSLDLLKVVLSVIVKKKLTVHFPEKLSRQDQFSSSPLKQDDNLITDTSRKANIQNQQFQSVFTAKEPLSLSRSCTMKLQDMTDQGTIFPDSVPPNPPPPRVWRSVPNGGIDDFSGENPKASKKN